MSIEKFFTALAAKKVSCVKSSIFALFVGLFVIFGGASNNFAQEGNKYEEPWFPAARFAVKEGGKQEKATISLVKVENASFTTGEEGLTFQICMAVDVQKGSKKPFKRYVRTTVFRNDKTMAYTLKKWKLLKKTPPDCQ